jgi:hypothetical protein
MTHNKVNQGECASEEVMVIDLGHNELERVMIDDLRSNMGFTGKWFDASKSIEIREDIYELLDNRDLVLISSTPVPVVDVGIENKLEDHKEVSNPHSQILTDKSSLTNLSYGGSNARHSSKLRIKKLMADTQNLAST